MAPFFERGNRNIQIHLCASQFVDLKLFDKDVRGGSRLVEHGRAWYFLSYALVLHHPEEDSQGNATKNLTQFILEIVSFLLENTADRNTESVSGMSLHETMSPVQSMLQRVKRGIPITLGSDLQLLSQ